MADSVLGKGIALDDVLRVENHSSLTHSTAQHFCTALKDKQENAASLKQPNATCGCWTDCEDSGVTQQRASNQ